MFISIERLIPDENDEEEFKASEDFQTKLADKILPSILILDLSMFTTRKRGLILKLLAKTVSLLSSEFLYVDPFLISRILKVSIHPNEFVENIKVALNIAAILLAKKYEFADGMI